MSHSPEQNRPSPGAGDPASSQGSGAEGSGGRPYRQAPRHRARACVRLQGPVPRRSNDAARGGAHAAAQEVEDQRGLLGFVLLVAIGIDAESGIGLQRDEAAVG